MRTPIECISQEAFAPFGTILAFTQDCMTDFQILVKETEKPWRLAVYRYQTRSVYRLERHPSSYESFEPLHGATLLFVAMPETPQDYRVFLLDQPICLHKNIWHQTMALSHEASVKITENLEVASEFWDLPNPVSAMIMSE